MIEKSNNDDTLVQTYLKLRTVIGILGISLPFILFFGGLIFFDTGLKSSISSYYYSDMRDVLVGILVAFGVFLYAYRGYDNDTVFGKIACVCAIGIALFPTNEKGVDTNTISILHQIFTTAFFGTLIYFSYFLFTKSDQENIPKKKQQRNQVYKICAILMAICVLGIVIDAIFPAATSWLGENLVFWLEAGAIVAFGVSWFTKGEAIAMLND